MNECVVAFFYALRILFTTANAESRKELQIQLYLMIIREGVGWGGGLRGARRNTNAYIIYNCLICYLQNELSCKVLPWLPWLPRRRCIVVSSCILNSSPFKLEKEAMTAPSSIPPPSISPSIPHSSSITRKTPSGRFANNKCCYNSKFLQGFADWQQKIVIKTHTRTYISMFSDDCVTQSVSRSVLRQSLKTQTDLQGTVFAECVSSHHQILLLPHRLLLLLDNTNTKALV